MLPVLIIATSVVFLILMGILMLTFFIPFVNNILEELFKGEFAVSVIEMFLVVFIFLTIIFGGFALLVSLL
jgi:hypothetical protein